MAQLRGGTTIAGYPALHSGLAESQLNNLTINGKLNIASGSALGIFGYQGKPVVIDHNNGNITLSATGGQLYLGYSGNGTVTTSMRLAAELRTSDSTKLISSTDGTLYYKGEDLDARYLNHTDTHLKTDLDGNTTYPRLVVNNGGATDNNWLRVGGAGNFGLLPYANGSSFLGTSSWQFQEVHGVNLYESSVKLSDKYSPLNHNHDGTYLSLSGGTLTGSLNVGTGVIASIPGIDLVLTGTSMQLDALTGITIGANDMQPPVIINGETTLAKNLYMPLDSSIHTNGVKAIEFFGPNNSGSGVSIGAGGMTIIGGGEAAATLKTGILAQQSGNAGFEHMYVGSDFDVNVYSNVNASFADGRLMKWNRDGALELTGSTQTLKLGRTKYWAGSLSGGDAIWSDNGLHVGAGGPISVWSENSDIRFRVGATGSVKTQLGISNNGRIYGYAQNNPDAEEIKTYWDNTNGGTLAEPYCGTTGWYTIAYNGDSNSATATGGDRAFAKFTILDSTSSRHQMIQFLAGVAYNRIDGATLMPLAGVKYGSGETLGGVRLLTAGTYAVQFLQVYILAGSNIRVVMEDNYWQRGWMPVNLNFMNTIPTGYTATKLEMQEGYANRPQAVMSGAGAPPSQGSFIGDIYVQY